MKPVRIGLSATQKPIEEIARFLTGSVPGKADAGATSPRTAPVCRVVDAGHRRMLDLGLETPLQELTAVCSNEHWEEIYDRLKILISQHRSTLIFVNTRKLAERVAFHLAAALGEEQVASHHGSLSRTRRLAAEEKLKHGELKAIVATASLELGIDVGAVDLVCQIGSPRSIATFLQRVGRAGHSIGATPKGRLFPLTRDELIESLALLRATRAGELDKVVMPVAPLDILAQQVIAETGAGDVQEDALYASFTRAYPFRDLSRPVFDEVLAMLASGYAEGRERAAPIVRDRIQGRVRARGGARLTALTSGGAIPEQGDYRVVTGEDRAFVGTINEDFAIESAAGDIFLLGSTSWRILQVRSGEVVVEDAAGAPPSVPFWLGESPGRTPELSEAVSELREDVDRRIELAGRESDPLFQLDSLAAIRALNPDLYKSARGFLAEAIEDKGTDPDWAHLQAVHYIAAQKAAMGLVPNRRKVVFERFFDDTGGMQLVIHAPFGMRVNKAFGLALRKRFCRSFDFELQASADNDGVVLSLGPHQSFPIEQLFKMLSADNAEALLVQALLAVPLFQIRWRWNVGRALANPRHQRGKPVPPPLQRFRAEDLLTACFPQQTQCKEHVVGDIEVPDHPLVRQTVHDCLHEAMDIEGLVDILKAIEAGEIELVARDTREPSPFSYQLLNANPYAFLDDAPLEERRARAIATRRTLPLGDLSDLSRLDDSVIEHVSRQAWPSARSADELHEALMALGVVPRAALPDADMTDLWTGYLAALMRQGRAGVVWVGATCLWFATENLPLIEAAYSAGRYEHKPALPPALARTVEPEDAVQRLVQGYLEHKGVLTAEAIAADLALDLGLVAAVLPAIEGRGVIVRGQFTGRAAGSAPADAPAQWCERRLLQRIHRLTLDGLRRQIKPVPAEAFMGFLLDRHGLTSGRAAEGKEGLLETLALLQGFDAAAGAWESEILPSRVAQYQTSWLDELTHGGIAAWGRLIPPYRSDDDGPLTQGMTRTAPIAFMLREAMPWILPMDRPDVTESVRGQARPVLELLQRYGALFTNELRQRTGLLETELDDALGELTRLGLIHADGFGALRPFVAKNKKSMQRLGLPRRFARVATTYALGGRWSLFGTQAPVADAAAAREARAEAWASLLMARYGIVFRDLLTREQAAPDWWELARIYRRREARGEVRGGRFVAGDLGEQFAEPEAVEELRAVQQRGERGDIAVVCAADPLNLTGIIALKNGEERVAASRNVSLAFVDGALVAKRDGAETSFLASVSPTLQPIVSRALQLGGVFRARLVAAP